MNYKTMFGLADDGIMIRPVEEPAFAISFTDKARTMKEQALEAALPVLRVSDPDEHRKAVLVQSLLKEALSLIEKSRTEAKKPALEYGRKLDKACKDFAGQLSDEMLRVSLLVGNYQMEQEKRVQAERALRENELARVEAKRLAEIALAQSGDEMDAINEQYNELARNTPLIVPDRVKGQVVREDYDITVYDKWALARAHPACVRIEELIGEIKSLIRSGVARIPGVSWKKQMKADVRLQKPVAIEI